MQESGSKYIGHISYILLISSSVNNIAYRILANFLYNNIEISNSKLIQCDGTSVIAELNLEFKSEFRSGVIKLMEKKTKKITLDNLFTICK